MLGPSDGELWAAGGDDAFTQLFERHAEAVWNHAYRLTGSWSLAEDLTSMTFMTAWRRRHELTLVRDRARPWLYAVAGFLARTARRGGGAGGGPARHRGRQPSHARKRRRRVIVVDASAMSTMLVYTDDRGRKARAALARDIEWVAPEHWKAEVFSVVRVLTLGRKITEAWASGVVSLLPRVGVKTVSLDDLLPRMWELRGNVSGYDAAYVALAEARGVTLVTADGKLARAAMSFCRVELVG